MEHLLSDIHEHLRRSRAHGGPPVAGSIANTKKYGRFKSIPLSAPVPLEMRLDDVLKKRVSANEELLSLSLKQVGQLIGHSLANHDKHRAYPSGGGLYPIETYALAYDVEGLERGIFHYRPDTNSLEQIFLLPEDATSDDIVSSNTQSLYPLLLLFTSVWSRSHTKYHDFALALALMETGHMMQNLQLVGTALSLGTRPMGGFKDAVAAKLLDIELEHESILCAMAVGANS